MHGANSVGDLCPCFSIIFCFKNVWSKIIALIFCTNKISFTFFKRIGFYTVPHHPLAGCCRRYILPVFTAVFTNMYQSVITARPQQVFFQSRFCCCKNGTVNFNAGVVFCNGTATGSLPFFIIGC